MVRFIRLSVLFILVSTLQAWNAAGHRIVAFIAYQNLSARARSRVDLLLQAHPDYNGWVEGVPAQNRPLEAFLHASVWADEIKGDPNYQDEPKDAISSAHPTYPDHFRHRNWHYIDAPLIGDYAALRIDETNKTWRNPPTVVTQIRLMENVLRDKHATEAAKAWALAWLIHLVSDLHQPLHCVSHYSIDASGKLIDDQGGNRVALNGTQRNLHAFWDDVMGVDTGTPSVRALGTNLIAASIINVKDPGPTMTWVEEGEHLSIVFVYRELAGAPVEDGAITIPEAYKRVAENVAAERVTIAGYRLAAILNKSLTK